MRVPNPHDHFFRQSFGRVDIARNYLEEYLPEEIVLLFDLEKLELQPDHFIDEELREHQSDMLYQTELVDGNKAYIYFLFEHKSYNDSLLALQLLRYMVRFWEREVQEKRPLTIILPLVIYHGSRPWIVPYTFGELIDIPDVLKPYTPDFRYHLSDFSYQSDEEVRGRIWLRVVLAILKAIFDPKLNQELDGLMDLAFELQKQQTGLDFIRTILYYLTRATGKVSVNDLQTAVLKQGQKGEKLMKTIAEQWLEEGREEGLKQGLKQGLEQGAEKALQQIGWRLLNNFEAARVSELMGVPLERVISWQQSLGEERGEEKRGEDS
ncbi:MAG TPA: Rpn family recombination-promoting nuclease/putative transposase [Anaerolineae bacterium]|nr:Rpn family recombination-promoting nuclease/putative transposase [Anaerolineae bacterium]